MNTKETFRHFFTIKGLEVSDKGSVRRTYKDIRTYSGEGLYPKYLKWQTDDDGNVIVNTKDQGDLRVDELVAKCFWGNPRGEKTYLIHLDKDKMNCSKNNLQWVTREEFNKFYEDDPVINTEDGFRKVQRGLYVSSDGKVKEKKRGKVMEVHDTLFDADINRFVAIRPHVTVYEGCFPKRVYIEDLVVEAFLPRPTNGTFMELLHKDNDYKNCALDNLEWVNRDDERYKLYWEQRKKDMDERDAELNK